MVLFVPGSWSGEKRRSTRNTKSFPQVCSAFCFFSGTLFWLMVVALSLYCTRPHAHILKMTFFDEEKLHFLSMQFVMNGHSSKLKHFMRVHVMSRLSLVAFLWYIVCLKR